MPNYIVKARASYQLVRGVPSDCQAKVGKKKWKEGGGKTINEARAKLPAFLARTDALIAQARAEQLTNEELVIRQCDVEGWSAVVLAQEANPHVAERFDDGSYNPEFESMVAMAEAVKAGKANALLSTQGLLQARRLDREPAPRTFEGWVKALHAFMAFTGKSKPFQCTRADAVSYKDALLTRMSRGSAKTQWPTWLDCGRRWSRRRELVTTSSRAYPEPWTKPPRAKHSAQQRLSGINRSSPLFHTNSGAIRFTCLCSSCCTSRELACRKLQA